MNNSGHLLYALMLALLLSCNAAAQDFRVLDPAMDPAPSRMLSSYLQRIAAEQLAKRRERISSITTREQFEQRRAEVRSKLLSMIGGLPAERTPLNVRRVGRLDRGDYRVEKVIYESLPRFYVTASLYIPQTGTPPYPAVLQPVGHSLTAKAGGIYQSLSIGLAKYGFVVLTYDAIGQGERRIFWDEDLQDSKVGGATAEHSMVGRQSLLAGESVARYRIWDGMRGIDLLQSLPEVDPKRIGVSGCSGGGTLTAYIAALDDRIQVAAPACYISSWEEQLLGTGPQDAEQQFPDQLMAGLNHADLVTSAAPKPYLICSTTEDFFPIEGARRTFDEAKRIYSLFGAEEKIGRFIGPGDHGMRQDTREAIYAWMKRWLKDDPAGATPEPQFQLEFEEDLNCTSTGQVATSLGGETASSSNMKRFREITPSRPVSNLKEEVLRLTRYSPSRGPLNLRSLGQIRREGYRVERLVYDGDRGRYVPALLCIPDEQRSRRKVILYVDQAGKSTSTGSATDVDQLARLGYTVIALDPAGIGETAVREGFEKVVWLGLMVGKPLVGLRMDDILRGLEVLREKNRLYDGRVLGFGKGLVGVNLLHAAAIDPRIDGVILEGSLVSYRSVARVPIHRQIFEAVIPGVLGRYDLPDLVAGVAPRAVWLVNATSPLGQTLSVGEVESAYRVAGDLPHLKVVRRRATETISEAYPELR